MNCLRLLRPICFRPSFKFTSVKYVSQHPLKYMDKQEKWQEKDGLSKNWQLIYKAPMGNALNYAVAYLTTSTAIVAASSVYYTAFVFDVNTMNDPVIIGESLVIANNAPECLIYLGSFVLLHIAVKVLISKFAVRMYQKGDEYVAIFRGHWINSIVKHKFHLNEFKKLNPTFVVSWGDARFQLGKKHAILLDTYFRTPEYFNYLMYKKKME